MRFVSTLSRVFVLALSVSGVVYAIPASKTFGADFSAQPGDVFVQGGYTVVDNANFINTGEIEGKLGTITNVKWRFEKSPTEDPPTSVYIKVLRQKTGEPWRFSQVDQRQIIVREPAFEEQKVTPSSPNYPTYQAYVNEVYNFWNNAAGIALNALPAGYVLKTPGVSPPVYGLPLNIRELDFVGFYFPDKVSQVLTYESSTPADAIEWAMPGNFDWPYDDGSAVFPAVAPPHWSPQMRFTYPVSAAETCANQQTIDLLTVNWNTPVTVPAPYLPTGTFPFGLLNSRKQYIEDWRQYRNICSGNDFTPSNTDYGYVSRSVNEQYWKEGFVSRSKHRDFFAFTVAYESGGAPPCTTPGGCGDPQFIGFQGQNFQFHGMADEVFNLISTPTFQMNGNFKYISAGKCDYNDTACFTHPGTYVDQIGFMVGDIKIKAVSGSHENGLRVWMNDIEIHRATAGSNHKIIFAINNSTTETGSFQYTQTGRVALDLPQFHVEIINSDYFFNMEVSIKDANVLRAGAKQVKLREKVLCAADGMKTEDRMVHVESRMAKHYPRVPIHGLIGQTWRNALICDHPWVGDASDYVTSSLFASDSAFNYFGTQQ